MQPPSARALMMMMASVVASRQERCVGYRQLCVEGLAPMMADMLVTESEITHEQGVEHELLEVWTTVDPYNRGVVSAAQFFATLGGAQCAGGRFRPPSPTPGPSHYALERINRGVRAMSTQPRW